MTSFHVKYAFGCVYIKCEVCMGCFAMKPVIDLSTVPRVFYWHTNVVLCTARSLTTWSMAAIATGLTTL